MRLDFSNVGKGLVAIADARKARDLARESERYNVTEGAYGEGLQANVQQVEQMRDQALRDAAARQGTVQDLDAIRAQFDPSIAELQRRSQMTAPDFSIASGQQTFGTREEAARAARPMRAEGLARTYERFGDVDRAEAMRERADTSRFRDLQMRGLERTDRQAAAVEAVDADTSKWMTSRLTNEDGTMRAPTMDDTVAAIQHRAALFQQKGLGEQAAAAIQQHASIAANQIQLQTAERNQALSTVAAGIASGNFAAAQNFYDRFIPDGAKVTDIKEGRDGRITISRTALDGTKLPDTSFANRNEMLAALNSVRDPMSLYNYAQQEFDNNIKTQTLRVAQTRANADRPRPMSEADITTRARAMVDLGTPDPDNPNNTISFAKALQIVRQEARTGVPYESAADRIVRLAIENQPPAATPAAPAAPAAAATPTRGLFTDPQGRTQILEPFSRFGDWRRRLVDEANARDAASGLSSAGF